VLRVKRARARPTSLYAELFTRASLSDADCRPGNVTNGSRRLPDRFAKAILHIVLADELMLMTLACLYHPNGTEG